MAKVAPNMRASTATAADDEIRVKASGSTVIKVSGGLPSSSSSSSQKSGKPEVAISDVKQEVKQRKVSGQHSRNLSKSELPAAAAALAAEKNKKSSSEKNEKQKRSSDDPADSSRQNPDHPVTSVDYGVVSGSSPVPPPAPPLPKTTHFKSPPENGVSQVNTLAAEPDASSRGTAATLSSTNGAARLISQTPLNQSFESEESSNGGYGKNSPDPIISKKRHRKVDDDEMGGGARCCFGFLMSLAQILLHGALGLVLYWVFMFHRKDGQTWPFAWKTDAKAEFWLHPVLMIAGFIYFMGQSMLMYRTCRCCRRIWNKLLHTTFHMLAIPCVALAFIAVWDSHQLARSPQNDQPQPIPDFYSLHSWMGFATMGLFALQFIVGFFSFLLLLCCESATASFRASLVPIHSTFGITTFVMAVATCCSGLTEKAFFTLRNGLYSKWVNYVDLKFDENFNADQFQEALVINSLGAALIGLLFVVPILVLHPRFRTRPQSQVLTVTSSNHHHQDRYA